MKQRVSRTKILGKKDVAFLWRLVLSGERIQRSILRIESIDLSTRGRVSLRPCWSRVLGHGHADAHVPAEILLKTNGQTASRFFNSPTSWNSFHRARSRGTSPLEWTRSDNSGNRYLLLRYYRFLLTHTSTYTHTHTHGSIHFSVGKIRWKTERREKLWRCTWARYRTNRSSSSIINVTFDERMIPLRNYSRHSFIVRWNNLLSRLVFSIAWTSLSIYRIACYFVRWNYIFK